jgi:hypothetical protein
MDRPEAQRIQVFVSYAHADKKWLQRLLVHLKPLRELCELEQWDDTRIKPGSKWKQEIRAAVDRASVAILIVSADFLASEFIRTDELPPLLKAAEEEGALILPVIVSPCLFSRMQHLSQFQAVNDPAAPLVMLGVGEQEAAFVRVAEAIFAAAPKKRARGEQTTEVPTLGENFLNTSTWYRLLKIGDWILDETKLRILGAGTHAFLVSREEYGENAFRVQAVLEFSNFVYPDTSKNRLGMNAGLIFGWKDEKQTPRYYNVLLTGSDIMLERNGFDTPEDRRRHKHLTKGVPLPIIPNQSVELVLDVDQNGIRVTANGEQVITHERPTGVVGRVGLRPWRSQMECTKFVISTATPTLKNLTGELPNAGARQ